MFGSFDIQKMRRDKPKDEESVRRDPKRDKNRKNNYSFQRNQKRGDLDASGDRD